MIAQVEKISFLHTLELQPLLFPFKLLLASKMSIFFSLFRVDEYSKVCVYKAMKSRVQQAVNLLITATFRRASQ